MAITITAGAQKTILEALEVGRSLVTYQVLPYLDYDGQECLRATSKAMFACVKAYHRKVIPRLFDPFIKNLFPGGAAEFKALPIQIVRQIQPHSIGCDGSYAVKLEPSDLVKVHGRIPSVVIGVEVNEGNTFILGDRVGHQPFRPFLAIVVDTIRESRICCLPPLSVELSVHTIFKSTIYTHVGKTWGVRGFIGTRDEGGFAYFFGGITAENGPRCFERVKQILANERLEMGITAPSTCNCCLPDYCPATPYAPFQALLYDTSFKLKKA